MDRHSVEEIVCGYEELLVVVTPANGRHKFLEGREGGREGGKLLWKEISHRTKSANLACPLHQRKLRKEKGAQDQTPTSIHTQSILCSLCYTDH